MNRPGNQLHGKKFENLIQKAFGCPQQYFRGVIDLPSIYDDFGMQGQVKSVLATRDRIDLADAGRFWCNQNPIHLIVGSYEREGLEKVFTRITEYGLGRSALRKLKGKLPSWEVERLHAEVKTYARGNHDEARIYAALSICHLESTYGKTLVMLNAKIDSKSQRRIQCSVLLRYLEEFKIREHVDELCGLKLPHRMIMESDE